MFELVKNIFHETSVSSRKLSFCKAVLRLKSDPFVRQHVKSGPLCKANFLKDVRYSKGQKMSNFTFDI